MELYSEFKLYAGKELIQVSKSGNICILYPHVTRSKLKYADRTNSKLFHDIILDSQNPNINVYSLSSASDGTFMLLLIMGSILMMVLIFILDKSPLYESEFSYIGLF
ncbi:MAG: hypothetical protein IPQ02_08975 [Saprospiraceae bacterium]|nr:hypothetical protein [Candidatus Defluviibacterium haderslevense]